MHCMHERSAFHNACVTGEKVSRHPSRLPGMIQTPFTREKLDRLWSDPEQVLVRKHLPFTRDLFEPYLFWPCLDPVLDLFLSRATCLRLCLDPV